MPGKVLLAALLTWGGLTPGLEAQFGEEGALFLLLPIGAEGVGLARAMTAVESPESAFWNPAGLARLDRSRILVTQGDHVSGSGLAVSTHLARPGLGVLGLSYALLDAGTQDLTDETGTVLGSITVRQHQALLSVARAWTERIRTGGTLKWVQFRQGCRGQCPDAGVRATTYALDLGAQLRPLASVPWEVGILLAHLGPGLQTEDVDQSDPLPSRLRIATSYTLAGEVVEEALEVRFVVEMEERVRDPGSPSVLVGSEVALGGEDRISIRGGYVFGSRTQLDGAAIGFGLRYERFELGIARSLARGGPLLDQEPVHLTLGFVF